MTFWVMEEDELFDALADQMLACNFCRSSNVSERLLAKDSQCSLQWPQDGAVSAKDADG